MDGKVFFGANDGVFRALSAENGNILWEFQLDYSKKELKGKTPLEAAKKPNLNKLALIGITGMLYPLGPGINTGSDTAQLSILGFNPEKYYFGRGPIECLGINMNIL